MYPAIETIAATVVGTYAFLAVWVTLRAIHAASGLFSSNYLVAHEIDIRVTALTGTGLEELARQRRRKLSRKNFRALNSARRLLRHYGHTTVRASIYRLLPFCSDRIDIAEVFDREERMADRRGQLLANPFIEEICQATTLDCLAQHYREYRRRNRYVLINGILSPRRIVRGRGPYYARYWRKLFTYTGRGGGVGVLVSYLAAGTIITKLPLTVFGGVIALFAFLVKSLHIWAESYGIPWLDKDSRLDTLIVRQPFLVALLVSAAIIAVTASVRLIV